jgi:hypothetical protein
MDNKRLLWILNALVCVVIILQIFNLAAAENSSVAITSGNVATNLSINGNKSATNRANNGNEAATIQQQIAATKQPHGADITPRQSMPG